MVIARKVAQLILSQEVYYTEYNYFSADSSVVEDATKESLWTPKPC